MEFSYKIKEVTNFSGKQLVIYSGDQLDREKTRPRLWENVECYDSFGQKLWTVNGMKDYKYWTKKWFVGTRIYEGRLQLIDFSGNSFDLDMDTGKVTHYEFHK